MEQKMSAYVKPEDFEQKLKRRDEAFNKAIKGVPTEKYGTPIYINKEELHTIYNCDLSDAPHLDRQRDIFVFQCCIGCRVGDLVRLTKSDVINGAIKEIFTRAGLTRNVTYLNPLTEREEKVPINTISGKSALLVFAG